MLGAEETSKEMISANYSCVLFRTSSRATYSKIKNDALSKGLALRPPRSFTIFNVFRHSFLVLWTHDVWVPGKVPRRKTFFEGSLDIGPLRLILVPGRRRPCWAPRD